MTTGFEPATAKNSGPFTLYTDTTPDLVAWMPEGAADKLRALRQRIADLHELVPEFEERKVTNEARFEAEVRLRRLQDHPHDGGYDPRVIDAQRKIDKLTAEARGHHRPL
jgi:hypothetical protein